MGKLGDVSNHGNDIAQPHRRAQWPLFGWLLPWIGTPFIPKLGFFLAKILIDGALHGRDRSRSVQTQLPVPQGAIPLLLPAEARRRRHLRLGNYNRF